VILGGITSSSAARKFQLSITLYKCGTRNANGTFTAFACNTDS
jgi:hypothetical protein